MSCPIPSTAFSLLWQIIELIESNAETTQLLNEDTLNTIVSSLEENNIDKNVSLGNKSLSQLFTLKVTIWKTGNTAKQDSATKSYCKANCFLTF